MDVLCKHLFMYFVSTASCVTYNRLYSQLHSSLPLYVFSISPHSVVTSHQSPLLIPPHPTLPLSRSSLPMFHFHFLGLSFLHSSRTHPPFNLPLHQPPQLLHSLLVSSLTRRVIPTQLSTQTCTLGLVSMSLSQSLVDADASCKLHLILLPLLILLFPDGA